MEIKMKRLICVILVLSLSACVSTIKEETLTTSRIYDIKGKTAEFIYKQSLDYLAYTFKDSKSVIEVKDPERCKIIGRGQIGSFDENFVRPVRLYGTITLNCKEGKSRLTVSNLIVKDLQFREYLPYDYSRSEVEEVLSSFLNNYNNFTQKKEDDNW